MLQSTDIQSDFLVPNLTIAILMVSSNAILIHGIRKLNKLQSISWRHSLALSINNTFYGTIIVTRTTVLKLINDLKTYTVISLSSRTLLFICGLYSFLLMFLITVDRYIHITRPMQYNLLMTPRKSKLLLAILFAISFILTCIIILGFLFRLATVILPLISIIAFACFMFLVILYYRAYKTLERRTRQARFQRRIRSNLRNPSKAFSKAVLLTISSMVVCCIPFLFIKPISSYYPKDRTIQIIEFIADDLVYANWVSNAFIMIYLDRRLRNYVKRTLTCSRNRFALTTTQITSRFAGDEMKTS